MRESGEDKLTRPEGAEGAGEGKKRDKRKVKTVIKTLLTHQRKLVRKRGPPIEGRGITWTLSLVIKSKRN